MAPARRRGRRGGGSPGLRLAAALLPVPGIAAIVALHWLDTGPDPDVDPVSAFGTGDWGWLLAVALTAIGIGAWSLSRSLRGLVRSAVSRRLLVVFAVAIVLVGFLPADRQTGDAHGFWAFAAFISLLPAMAALVRPLSREAGLGWLSGPTAIATVVAALLWLGAGEADPDTGGIHQRVFLALTFGWVAVAAPACALASLRREGRR